MEKKCTGCLQHLPIECFSIDSGRKDGRNYRCRECVKLRNNTPSRKQSRKRRYLEISQTEDFKKSNQEKSRVYYWKYRDSLLQKQRESKLRKRIPKTEEEKKAHARRHVAEFRQTPRYKRWRKNYEAERKKNDPCYALACGLRSRMKRAVEKGYRSGSAVQDLGCSIEEFKAHLESKFQEGMNWGNWGLGPGNWNIDHIIPLCRFVLTDRQHFILAAYYLNLQPLWFEENMAKLRKRTV